MFLTIHVLCVQTISHDDAIAYLAATGHQALYPPARLETHWCVARDWQALWTPDRFWCFRTIAHDLATCDIHPPLYFWILHVWLFLFGIKLPVGLLLNIPCHLLACVAITATCRLLKIPWWIAASAGLLWLFCGANFFVAMEVRQYSLMAAISAWFAFALVNFMLRPTWSTTGWLGLVTALGMLTHYHFLLLLAACGATAGFQALAKRQWRTLWMLSAAVTAAAIVFYALHPNFYLSFTRESHQAQPFAWKEVPIRFATVAITLLQMAIPEYTAYRITTFVQTHWSLVLIAAAVGSTLLAIPARRFVKSFLLNHGKKPEAILSIGSILCLAMIIFLYVSCRSPRHAMSAKYLMVVSPLLFMVLGQILAAINKKHHRWGLALVAALLLMQTTFAIRITMGTVERARPAQPNPLVHNDLLVMDSVERGVLPTVLWHANPAMPVFASGQNGLRGAFPRLPKDARILYVSDLRGGNSVPGRQAILSKFADQGYTVADQVKTGLWVCEAYELRK